MIVGRFERKMNIMQYIFQYEVVIYNTYVLAFKKYCNVVYCT